ncbi:MAG TPA: hypothetical protein VI547_13470 [Anaerolineales bacterium]|nr:hypothetical protein [Anaerolineales bacterium]
MRVARWGEDGYNQLIFPPQEGIMSTTSVPNLQPLGLGEWLDRRIHL